MKVIRYLQSWFHVVHGVAVAKFEAGKHYPVNEETERHVAQGIAEVVDAPEDAPKAEAAADKAEADAAKAAEKAEAARAVADAATAAADIAQAPAA